MIITPIRRGTGFGLQACSRLSAALPFREEKTVRTLRFVTGSLIWTSLVRDRRYSRDIFTASYAMAYVLTPALRAETINELLTQDTRVLL